MKIITKKEVRNGFQGRIIIKIEGVLIKEKLPIEYLAGGGEAFFKYEVSAYGINGLNCNFENDRYFESFLLENNFYPEEKFQEILVFIKKAGARLHKINKKIKKLKISWYGEETFMI